MRLALSLLALGAFIAPDASCAASGPVVVELFTSEGCSSCPPADAYLNELAGRSDVLPLAFHVTYWNALGWRDPFSLDAATQRQANYAARLGGGSYTPEMVVEGRRGLVGSDREAIASAIATARAATQPALRLSRSGGTVAIDVGQSGMSGRIVLIGFDRRHETTVGRGENAGRTLIESNIVRSMRTIGAYTGAPLRVSAQKGAGDDVAAIVQGADGRIIGAGRL